MARGKTVSITLPTSLADHYDKLALDLNTSRSRVILNVLINDFKGTPPKSSCVNLHGGDCVLMNDECSYIGEFYKCEHSKEK